MKKKLSIILLVALAVICILALVACEPQDEEECEEKVELLSSWAGSYSVSNAMGNVVSGHLLNFYSDGTCTIYYGIKAGVNGHHFGVYYGTYEGNTVSYSYVKSDTTDESTDTFEVDLSAQHFQCKVFCLANYPNSAGGGINYVRIPEVEPDKSADYIYVGSFVSAENFCGGYIEVRDGAFDVRLNINGKMGGFGGSSSLDYSAVTDVDTPDYLCLTYKALTIGNAVEATGSSVENKINFNDTTYLSHAFTLANGESLQRITYASIRTVDGEEDI